MSAAIPQPTPPRLSSWHYAFAAFGIIYYQGAFVLSFRYMRGDDHLIAGESEITGTIAQAIIMVVLIGALWARRQDLRRVMPDLTPYLLVIVLCIVSVLWSAYPLPTARRSVTFSICVFFGIWCHLVLGFPRLLRWVAHIIVFLGICSIVVFFVLPSVGRETALGYGNAMRGVFAQKNTLGSAMLLAISCYVYEMIRMSRGRWLPALMVIFMLCCEILAQSATSALLSIAVIVIGGALMSRRNWRLYAIFIYCSIIAVLFVIAALIIDSTAMFNLIGRDMSFTGRMPLWEMSLQAARARPLLGYGYNGFWTGDARIVQYIWAMIDWKAPSAHNGYLDIVLQIGVIGLALYMWIWGKVVYVAWLARNDASAPEASWILLFMFINIVLNTDEGPLPYPDQFTLLMPGAMIFLAGWMRSHRALMATDLRARAAPIFSIRTRATSALNRTGAVRQKPLPSPP